VHSYNKCKDLDHLFIICEAVYACHILRRSLKCWGYQFCLCLRIFDFVFYIFIHSILPMSVCKSVRTPFVIHSVILFPHEEIIWNLCTGSRMIKWRPRSILDLTTFSSLEKCPLTLAPKWVGWGYQCSIGTLFYFSSHFC
jgi:hypothetical protein